MSGRQGAMKFQSKLLTASNREQMDAAGKPHFEVDYDVGNLDIDKDHHALAHLIDKTGNACEFRSGPNCDSAPCSDEKRQCCFDVLVKLGTELQLRLVEHFQRENEMMTCLQQREVATKSHCEGHKKAHVGFSTRYNALLARADSRQPSVGLRELHDFTFDWGRDHVIKYDRELACLLNAHGLS